MPGQNQPNPGEMNEKTYETRSGPHFWVRENIPKKPGGIISKNHPV